MCSHAIELKGRDGIKLRDTSGRIKSDTAEVGSSKFSRLDMRVKIGALAVGQIGGEWRLGHRSEVAERSVVMLLGRRAVQSTGKRS